ncbi:MAG: RDD family protein [Gammaproteobacteria bacterium]|nr:RDD family protein [Gammaproteobacteria bacterium]MDE0368044.1 RDD family protein [Gammaproteobacteria bacterium]
MATPPVSEPESTPAGLLRRLAAMVYDGLLVLALWLITLLAMVIANGGDAVYGALVQSVLFLEAYLFFAWFWLRAGETAGMRAWRLRLVSNDGGAITLNQATVRLFAAMVSIGILGLGYWWALFDTERRTWPDLWSGSRILYRAP